MAYPVSEYSCIPRMFENCLQQKKEHTLASFLKETELLHTFFTHLIIELLENCNDADSVPEYLLTVKHLFDDNYSENYTLDSLSTLLHINKYRLCHEFTAHYGLSPLQYLNRRRIEAACKLLSETKHHIYQIGTMVGICNTNHFIHLFKRYCGVTPAVYRENHY